MAEALIVFVISYLCMHVTFDLFKLEERFAMEQV